MEYKKFRMTVFLTKPWFEDIIYTLASLSQIRIYRKRATIYIAPLFQHILQFFFSNMNYPEDYLCHFLMKQVSDLS
jgi:hypothetical protein